MDLQAELSQPELDAHRVDRIRAAVEFHSAAALAYAVLALVDTQQDPDRGPAARDAPGIASELARRGRPARDGAPVAKRQPPKQREG